MSLLPGGERGSHVQQLAWAAVVIWLGWQGFVNVHRWHAFDGNLSTLANEINVGGEEAFREHFVQVLEMNGQTVAPESVRVVLEEASGRYRITVPTAWTIDLGVWRLEIPTVRQTWVEKRPYLPSS